MRNNEGVYQVEVAVEKALLELGRGNIVHYLRIYRHWQVIIGEALSQKTFPQKLEKSRLTILVEDAAYAYHLRYFKNRILELIASPAICGDNVVRDITYSVGQLPEREVLPPENYIKIKTKQKKKVLITPALQKSILRIQDPKLQKKFSQLATRISLRRNFKNG